MNPLQSLARFARSQPGAPPQDGRACELCSRPMDSEHRHVFDLDSRRLHCVCRACALLFIEPRPGARYQTIGDRVLRDPGLRIPRRPGPPLQIPVRLAFFTWTHDRALAGDLPQRRRPDARRAGPRGLGADLGDVAAGARADAGAEALLVFSRRPDQPLEAFGVALDRLFCSGGPVAPHVAGFFRRRRSLDARSSASSPSCARARCRSGPGKEDRHRHEFRGSTFRAFPRRGRRCDVRGLPAVSLPGLGAPRTGSAGSSGWWPRPAGRRPPAAIPPSWTCTSWSTPPAPPACPGSSASCTCADAASSRRSTGGSRPSPRWSWTDTST